MDYSGQPSPSSYYAILGVDKDSSIKEIRSSYRKLAMQWHPDRWARNPSLVGEAKRKFQRIQEAYSVLSDQRKRTVYDAGLYDPNDDEDDEGFLDFVQEMISLMDDVKREERVDSMEELQRMFMEMAQGFESGPQWFCGPSIVEESKRDSKRARWESTVDRDPHIRVSGLEMFGRPGFCN